MMGAEEISVEVKACRWNELYDNTKKPVKKIIEWLYAASEQVAVTGKKEIEKLEFEKPSTSILIAGDRGSGKTTVLLSANCADSFSALSYYR